MNLVSWVKKWGFLYEEINFSDKSAIFFGDSVAYGHQINGNGFGYYVDSIANLSNYTNAAVNSATLNTETKGENNVIEQIKKNASTSYDFVILQGGYGDLIDQPEIGSITENYDVNEFDTTNGLQGVRTDHDASKEYWDIVKKTCNKWNVSYLDFFEGSTTYNGVTYAVGELDENATVVNLNRVEGDGQYHYGWHSDNITLTYKTKYIYLKMVKG